MIVKKRKSFFLLLFPFLIFHFFLLSKTPPLIFEEMLAFPWFIEKGLIFYRDVAIMYSPGVFYLLWAFYHIFGFSLSSLQAIGFIFTVLTDVAFFYVCRQLFRSKIITALVMFFYIFWHPMIEGKLVWFEMLLSPLLLMAFVHMRKFLKEEKKPDLLKSGFFFALSFLIKQTVAWSFLFSAIFIFLFIPGRLTKRFLYIQYFMLFPVIAFVVLITVMFYADVQQYFLFWTTWVPFHVYAKSGYYVLRPRRPDISPLSSLFFLAGFTLFVTLLQKSLRRNRFREIFFTSGWVAATLLFAYPRWGLFHLTPALLFISIHLGYLLEIFFRFSQRNVFRTFVSMGLIIVFVLTSQQIKYFWYVKNPIRINTSQADVALREAVHREIGEAPFFSLEIGPLLYFELGRGPYVLPWIPVVPGFNLLPELEQQILDGIERQKIPYVVHIQINGISFEEISDLSKKFRSYVLSHYRRKQTKEGTIVEIYERF